jgi:hypothetical protein
MRLGRKWQKDDGRKMACSRYWRGRHISVIQFFCLKRSERASEDAVLITSMRRTMFTQINGEVTTRNVFTGNDLRQRTGDAPVKRTCAAVRNAAGARR